MLFAYNIFTHLFSLGMTLGIALSYQGKKMGERKSKLEKRVGSETEWEAR